MHSNTSSSSHNVNYSTLRYFHTRLFFFFLSQSNSHMICPITSSHDVNSPRLPNNASNVYATQRTQLHINFHAPLLLWPQKGSHVLIKKNCILQQTVNKTNLRAAVCQPTSLTINPTSIAPICISPTRKNCTPRRRNIQKEQQKQRKLKNIQEIKLLCFMCFFS